MKKTIVLVFALINLIGYSQIEIGSGFDVRSVAVMNVDDTLTTLADTSLATKRPGQVSWVAAIDDYYYWNAEKWKKLIYNIDATLSTLDDTVTAEKNTGTIHWVVDIDEFYYYDGTKWKETIETADIADIIEEQEIVFGTGTSIDGESALTWDGSTVDVDGNVSVSDTIKSTSSSGDIMSHNGEIVFYHGSDRMGLGDNSQYLGTKDIIIGDGFASQGNYGGALSVGIGNDIGQYLNGPMLSNFWLGFNVGKKLLRSDTNVFIGHSILSCEYSPGVIEAARNVIIGSRACDNLGAGLTGGMYGNIIIGERAMQETYDLSGAIYIGPYGLDGTWHAHGGGGIVDSVFVMGTAGQTGPSYNLTNHVSRNTAILSGLQNHNQNYQWLNINGSFGINYNNVTDTMMGARHPIDIRVEPMGDFDGDTSFVYTETGRLGLNELNPDSVWHFNGGGKINGNVNLQGKLGIYESDPDSAFHLTGGGRVEGDIAMAGFLDYDATESIFMKWGGYPMFQGNIARTIIGYSAPSYTATSLTLVGNTIGNANNLNGNSFYGGSDIGNNANSSLYSASNLSSNCLIGTNSWRTKADNLTVYYNISMGRLNLNQLTGNSWYNITIGNNIYKDTDFSMDSTFILHNGKGIGTVDNALLVGKFDSYGMEDQELLVNGRLGVNAPNPDSVFHFVGGGKIEGDIAMLGFLDFSPTEQIFMKWNGSPMFQGNSVKTRLGYSTPALALNSLTMIGNNIGNSNNLNGNSFYGGSDIGSMNGSYTASNFSYNTLLGKSSWITKANALNISNNIGLGAFNLNQLTASSRYNIIIGNNIYEDTDIGLDSTFIIHNGIIVGDTTNSLLFGTFDASNLRNQRLRVNGILCNYGNYRGDTIKPLLDSTSIVIDSAKLINIVNAVPSSDSLAIAGKRNWLDTIYFQEVIYINALILNSATVSVDDDDYIDLPEDVSGWGTVQAGDNEEWTMFRFSEDGTVTLINNTTNVTNTNADTNLCIFDNGTSVRISNRLGSTKDIKYEIHY